MGTNFFSDILLPIALSLITLGLGLSIEFKDFKNIFLFPKAVITGLFAQIFLLPLIAFIIAYFAQIDPIYKVGLIIIAACPGGATSNLVTFMLNGNVALSLSITVINSILSLFTIPLIVSGGLVFFLGANTKIHLPFVHTIINIFLIVIVPAIIGTTMRRYFRNFAIGLEKPLRYVLPFLLFIVYSGVVFIDKGAETLHLIDYIKLYPVPILLNALAMASGWILSGSLGIKQRNQYTIAIEVGLHNSTLAIYVAAVLIGSQIMAVVPVIYGSFSFFTTWGFGYILKRFTK
jgi:bile acid:Na+ symporter, BASS family